MIPCDTALQAMPGDKITFEGIDYVGFGTVKTAGWQPGPKGGKIWTYELVTGELVPYELVVKVEKSSAISNEPRKMSVQSQFDTNYYLKQDLLSLIDRYEMSSSLKTAVFAILEGDEKSLIVAEFLIQKRLSQLKSITGINHPNTSDVQQGENNGQ